MSSPQEVKEHVQKGKQVFALVAMAGAGKSFVASYLRDQRRFPVIRFGDETDRGLAKAGLSLTEDNERTYRENVRKELGMAAYAIKMEPYIDKVLTQSDAVFLDGLYSWEEYLYLKKRYQDIVLISIVSNRKIRYERLSRRDSRPLTNEEAYKRDVSEIEQLKKAGPIAIADYVIENNGTIDELREKIDALLQQLGLV